MLIHCLHCLFLKICCIRLQHVWNKMKCTLNKLHILNDTNVLHNIYLVQEYNVKIWKYFMYVHMLVFECVCIGWMGMCLYVFICATECIRTSVFTCSCVCMWHWGSDPGPHSCQLHCVHELQSCTWPNSSIKF